VEGEAAVERQLSVELDQAQGHLRQLRKQWLGMDNLWDPEEACLVKPYPQEAMPWPLEDAPSTKQWMQEEPC
jgi:hypothetical protein